MNAEKSVSPKMENVNESVFYIKDLDCSDCAMKVEKEIGKLVGVEKSQVNFATAKLFVSHIPGREEIIARELIKIGHPGTLENKMKKQVYNNDLWYLDFKTILTCISGLFLVFGLALSLLDLYPNLTIYIYILSILTGGFHVGRAGIYSLKSLSLDMNALMLVAVVGAAILGEWSEGAAVVFLFSLGTTLQTYTIDKTRKSIRDLMELAPNVATKKLENYEIVVDVEELNIKDILIVKPGERIPMDGMVLKGYSEIDQSPITGESIPVHKVVGDEVFAGTVNGNGLLEIEVTKLVEDTTLTKILNLVEEAQSQKAPTEQWVDKFAKYYTPIIIFLAIVITLIPPLLFQFPLSIWFKRALILLVIACPCALVISTPVSIVSAIGNASRRGILVKGGVHLEEFGKIKAIAFDKTGTLTIGKPVVLDIISKDNNELECLKIAANLEKGSEHPISKAFINKAKEEGIILDYVIEDFQAIPGKGLIASIESKKFFLGNKLILDENGIESTEYTQLANSLENQGKTVIYLATVSGVKALFVISDKIREESKSLVTELNNIGIDELYMLSGDNCNTAKAVAQEIGFRNYIGELLPENKLDEIRKLLNRHKKVAMVGDGVNDTPSLSLATVGVAMGAAGTDAALETANIALMGDDLNKISYTVALSRKTVNVIKQNIIFSIVVKLIFIILTVMGLSNLWMAVFADTGAALIVILNSMRLLKFNSKVT